MTSCLNLVFGTSNNEKYTLVVNNPFDDLTSEEIAEYMDDIIAIDPFNIDGNLTEKISAVRKTTTVREFLLV